MGLKLKSNSKVKGAVSSIPLTSPMPSLARLFVDAINSRFVIKHASGNLVKSDKITDILSFTRESPATYFGSDGLLKYAISGEPVFEYDPVTLKPLGVRVEFGTTNRIKFSDLFSSSAWNNSGLSISENDSLSPDGTKTASKIIESGTSDNSTHCISYTTEALATIGNPYTFSVFAKKNTASNFQLAISGITDSALFCNFNIESGDIGLSSPGSLTYGMLNASIIDVGGGYYRCSITVTPTIASYPILSICLTGNSLSSGAIPSYKASSLASIYIWGAQGESSDGPTSYIKTSGSEVKRESDILTTSSITNIVGRSGTVICSCGQMKVQQQITTKYSSLRVISLLDNSATGPHIRTSFRSPSSGSYGAALGVVPDSSGTATNLEIYGLTQSPGDTQKYSSSYDLDNRKVKAFDGLTKYERSVDAMPKSLSRICLGRSNVGSNAFLRGYIRGFIYFDSWLSDDDIEKYINLV